MARIKTNSAGKLVDYHYQKDGFFGQEKGESCSWVGTGAEKMGLTGRVDFEHLINLAHGYDKTGETKLVGREDHHLLAATEILLTLPKSVSIIALNSDKALLDDMAGTFKTTTEFIENFVQGRQTKDGVTENVDGTMTAMQSTHSMSRQTKELNGTEATDGIAIDPMLHSHVNVLNLTERQTDGTFSTVNNKLLFDNQKLIQQFQYNESAKVLLDHNIPITLNTTREGLVYAEVAGIPEEIKSLFSTMSNAIENADTMKADLEKRLPNLNEYQIKKMIQVQMKATKNSDITKEELQANWKERAEIIGHDLTKVIQNSYSTEQQQTEQITAAQAVTIAITDINENESKFKVEEVLLNAMKLSVGQSSGKEIETAVNESIKSGEMVKHGELYTTPKMIKIEQGIVDKATQSGTFDPLMSKEEVSKAITDFQDKKGFKLSDGQAEAIDLVLTGTGKIALISGSAGTGKTTSFEAVYDVLKNRTDIELIGLGASGKAGAVLEMDSGIKSQTVASYNLQKDEAVEVGKTRVIIVDEASLLPSADTGTLIDKEGKNTKFIFCGDGAQLLAVGSGRIFSDLVEISKEHGTIQHASITEVQRQKLNADGSNQYSIDATKAFQNHEVEKGFQILTDAGKITELETRDARIQLTAEKYVEANQHDGTLSAKHQIKLTAAAVLTNRDRIDVNEAIRGLQKEAGQIGKEDFVYNAESPVNLTAPAKRYAANYEVGNFATLTKDIIADDITIKAGSKLEIIERDISKNTISFNLGSDKNEIKVSQDDRPELERMKADNAIFDLNVKANGNRLNQVTMTETHVSENEKMIFTKGDNTEFGKFHSIKNNVAFIVTNLDREAGTATISTELGKVINDFKFEGSHTTNGAATTGHKQQGATVVTQIAMIDSSNGNMINENMNYVLNSRQTHELEIITDNTEKLIEHAKEAQIKTSTLDGTDNNIEKLQALIGQARETPIMSLDEVSHKLQEMIDQTKIQETTEQTPEQIKISEATADLTTETTEQKQGQETDKAVKVEPEPEKEKIVEKVQIQEREYSMSM